MRPLVLVGGVVLAVVNLVHQVVSSIQAHNFAVGHDFSSQAVEQALTKGAFNVGSQYVDLLAALALTAGIIVVSINAIRVGLLTRWLGVIGIFAGLLVFLPIGGATLEIIPAFWMAGMGRPVHGPLAERRPPGVALGRSAPVADAGRASRRARGGWGRRLGRRQAGAGLGRGLDPCTGAGGRRLAQARTQAPLRLIRSGRWGRARIGQAIAIRAPSPGTGAIGQNGPSPGPE